MKFVMSVFVVAIHRPIFGVAMPAADMIFNATLTRQAVPYFFTAAAFLFFGKAAQGEPVPGREALWKYLKHILPVYVIWSAVYFPVYYAEIRASAAVTAGQALREYAVRFLFYGSYLHLWFLPALAFLTALAWLLLKKLPATAVAGISLAVMLACRVAIGAGGKDGSNLPYYIDSAFFYLLFTAMGAHIARHDGPSQKAGIIGLAGSFILLAGSNILAERFRFGPLLGINMLAGSYNADDMPVYKNLFIIPLIYFLFGLMKNIRFKERQFYAALRPATSLIYLTHLLVPPAVLEYTARFLGVENPAFTGLACFTLALAFSLPLSFGMARLQRHKRFHWMKLLH